MTFAVGDRVRALSTSIYGDQTPKGEGTVVEIDSVTDDLPGDEQALWVDFPGEVDPHSLNHILPGERSNTQWALSSTEVEAL